MDITNAVQIGRPLFIWGMLSLVPFILMYLIRPKAKEQMIPSLMFLIKNQRHAKTASFFRNLMRTFLFFVQLIALTGLAFSLAMPYITIPYASSTENTIVILDGSASMQAKYGASTRFEKALSEIKPRISGRTSLVLAENQPLVLLKEGKKDEALRILSRMTPKATTTNIGDGLSIAKDILRNRKGKIIVVSDFVSDETSDIEVVRRDLMTKGNIVEFINVGNSARNIGIIDMKVDKYETRLRVKNYNEEPYNVNVNLVNKDGLIDETSVDIAANSVEALKFETPVGISWITLDVNDDFEVDNKVFVSTPLSRKINVLLITNEEETNLLYALEASKDIELEVRRPPTVNAFNIDHDVVIIDKVDKAELIPSDVVDIKRYVQRGGKLIITAQEDLARIDFLGMVPISIESLSDPAVICADIINQFTQQFEEANCFTSSKYFVGTAKEGAMPIASAGANPVMAMRDHDEGAIFYYGIIDKTSNFRTQPEYPIFWNELVTYLIETGDIKDYNFKTGGFLSIKEQKVTTPTTVIRTSNLILDENGLYEMDDKTIAVNLLDEQESGISGESIIEEAGASSIQKKGKESTDMSLELPLIMLALGLLWIELFYMKRRGDL